jgi:carbonic anhydrase/acetyltransferase-like protein (isoleucine patch superfamily)
MPWYELDGRKPESRSAEHFVAPNAMVIGSVSLEHQSSVWFNAVLRGDDEQITVGRRSNVQDGSVLHADPGYPLILGENVTIGHMVMLHGCKVGNGTLVGMGAIVLNGAKIGSGSLVGAGALVPEGKEIPDGVLVVGAPAKIVRTLSNEERDNLAKIAEIYVKRAERYRRELRLLPQN